MEAMSVNEEKQLLAWTQYFKSPMAMFENEKIQSKSLPDERKHETLLKTEFVKFRLSETEHAYTKETYKNAKLQYEKQLKTAEERLSKSENKSISLQKQLDTTIEELNKFKNDHFHLHKELGETKLNLDKSEEERIKLEKEKEQFQKEEKAVADNLARSENANKQLQKKKLCVMCINERELHLIWAALLNMKITQKIDNDIVIVKKRITNIFLVSEDDFQEADLIIAVAVSGGRNMIISDTEPSQLGDLYNKALQLEKHVMMIYMDNFKDSLKDSQLYHGYLETSLLDSQKQIGSLAKENRFISVKHKEKDEIQNFNIAQSKRIAGWIVECTSI